jgi:hypothetical protein
MIAAKVAETSEAPLQDICIMHHYSKAMSYLFFMLKLDTHRMYDSGLIVSHIELKVFTDNQMSQIK